MHDVGSYTIDMSDNTAKRIVLVTGASTGIGRSIALHLAQAGYTVFAGVRQPQVQRELQDLGHANLHALLLDVTDERSISSAFDTIREHTRSGKVLYGVINNAAICITGPLETLPLAQLREQLEVNILGVMAVTQAALPMLRASRGRIVNIGSNVGRLAPPFLGPYAASKAALEALSDTARRELKSAGIHVSLIVPGPVMTPVWNKITADNERWKNTADKLALERYQGAIARFTEMNLTQARRSRLTSEAVAELVATALASETPAPRYEIGMGAYAGTIIARLLPARWVDNAFQRVMHPAAAASK